MVDETLLNVRSEFIWLWVAIEQENKYFVGLKKLKERNLFVGEVLLSKLGTVYGKTLCSHRWQYMVRNGLSVPKSKTSFYFSYEKMILEKTMQYIKDNMECIGDYFPYKVKNGD